MGADALRLLRDGAAPTKRAVAGAKRPIPQPPEPQVLDAVRAVLLQMLVCGAALNRDSLDFARAITDILLWSAEHARAEKLTRQWRTEQVVPDWCCDRCGEANPGTFDLCWKCTGGPEEHEASA